MTLIPRHRAARYAAAFWVLACLLSLAAFLMHPGVESNSKTALAMLVPLYLTGMPVSHAAMLAVIDIRLRIYLDDGTVLSVLAEGLGFWAFLAVSGYLQWFVLLPWLARLLARLLRLLLNPSR
ncbi:MAG: hypothetical protein HYV99_04065 [Betaproteobacteria bacterium]|nr:hypothetical protein [Betaproteobacteria bacterium]MBI2509160.1 hypothetical protein [Betaproteobacteria bacterium]